MDEILELRRCLEEGRYDDALLIIDEMEEMAKDDKIHKIRSYVVILLVHLIKQHAERRTTRSWNLSLLYAIDEIQSVNARRKAGGTYLSVEELREIIASRFQHALGKASEETFGGERETREIAAMIDAEAIKTEALALVLQGAPDEYFTRWA